ncbi:MAG: hypothetical protein ACLFTI_01815 [Anaerolineales bacterium]
MNETSDRRAIGHDPFADMDIDADGGTNPPAEEAVPAEKEAIERALHPAETSGAPPADPAPSAAREAASAPPTETTLLNWLFSDAAHPDASYPRLRDFPTSQEAAKLLHDWLHS